MGVIATPETASEPLAETATGEPMCQPFDPFTAGYTGFTIGAVTSLFQVVEPVDDDRSLAGAVAL